MTNRPSDSMQENELILKAHRTTHPSSDHEQTEKQPEEIGHDFTAKDLMLQPGEKMHRDSIELLEDSSSELLLTSPTVTPRKKKRLPLVAKIFLGIAIALLVLILAAGAAYWFLYDQGRNEMLQTTELLLTLPEVLVESNDAVQSDDGRTVTYKGETYRFNEDRTNILCIGMDKTDLGLDYDVVGTAGQADTIVLLSIDTATGQTDALSISRDAIVDIDLHAEDGSFVGVKSSQICLAYAYGDGYHGSCDNMVKAVSRLLYGIPINTYFTVNLEAIPTLNDAVGGVEVVLLDDLISYTGARYSKGDTVVLYGRDAERYVRMRDTDRLASNNDRMARQKQYLGNFFNKALEATSQNLQVPLDLFNAVAADSVTNLSPSKITFLATTMVQHRRGISFYNMPGQVVEGADGKAEFHPNDEALYELILKLFFKNVTES